MTNINTTSLLNNPRRSNLELYRIVSMLMIVAYHYTVNSGLDDIGGPILESPMSINSLYLAMFGAWGKVGINCFLLITGYFMCTSKITIRKFLKLLLQIYFYRITIFSIFYLSGYESLSVERMVKLLMPVLGFRDDFISCFLAFYLTIPFLTILVHNLTKRQHELLIILMLICYTVLGTLPFFVVRFNYITWFGILFFISSYIRLHPNPLFDRCNLWGWLTLGCALAVFVSIAIMQYILGDKGVKLGFSGHYFVYDSNKLLAVCFALCSFLWFKNMNIKYNRIINAFGAGTFGVLLIHAHSSTMRTWLWKDTIDCVGHYSLPLGNLILYSVGVVMVIFMICNLIDQIRINTLEKWLFKWYDNRYAAKAEAFVSRIVNDKQISEQ